MKKIIQLASACILSLTSFAVSADLIAWEFEFSSTDGPIQFGTTTGYFAYDDSIVSEGLVTGNDLLIDLDVAFDTYSYDESSANTGWLRFDGAGNLDQAIFGSNCDAASCVLSEGDWWIWLETDPSYGYVEFSYAERNSEGYFVYGTLDWPVVRSVPARAVPEPATLALFGLGLAGIGFSRRKKA